MTAPSAPGVALFAGCFGVTAAGCVVGPFHPTAATGYFIGTDPCWTWLEDGAPHVVSEVWRIIHVEPTREKAEAWLRAYREAQDRAANPERRRAVAEVPEGGWGAEVLPAKPFNPVDWTPTPPPEAAPTPAPDWEARRWEAALAAAQGLASNCDETGLCAWLPEPLAVRAVQIADALIAAMKGERR